MSSWHVLLDGRLGYDSTLLSNNLLLRLDWDVGIVSRTSAQYERLRAGLLLAP